MQIVIKLYDSIRSTEPIYQDNLDSEILITKDLTSFDTASFRCPIIPQIQEYNKIEIFEVIQGQDNKVFGGYIYEITPIWKQFGMHDIVCRSEKALLQDRKSFGISVTGGTYQDILEQLVDGYNALGENWTIDCDNYSNFSCLIKQQDLLYDAIDDLAKGVNAVWNVENGVIYFKNSLGKDRSIEDSIDYQEIIYNDAQPGSANISNVQVKTTATRANIAMVEDYQNYTQVDTSQVAIDGKVYGVATAQFRDAVVSTPGITEKINNLLSKKNKIQRAYSFSVEKNTFSADIGDTVKIKIENTNSYFDINASAQVIKKNIIYSNGAKKEEYVIGEVYASPFEFTDWFLGVEKSIRQLQIK